MPMIIPIVMAAGSIYAGVTAIAAGSALIGGMMVAGGALSMVGTISGNQKLARIGGVLSLAGGVAGMMNGTWATAADGVAQESFSAQESFRASELAGTEATNAAMEAGAAGAATDAGMSAAVADAAPLSPVADVGPAVDVGGAGSDLLDAGGGEVIDAAAGDAVAPAANAAPTATGEPAGTSAFDPAAANQTAAPGSESAMKMAPDATPARAADPAAQAGDSFWGRAKQAATDAWDGAKQNVSDASKWMEKNPQTTKLASGMLAGAMQAYQRNQGIQDQFEMQQRAMADARQRKSASVTGPNGQGLMIPKWRPSGAGG